jgi:hypothetical protein
MKEFVLSLLATCGLLLLLFFYGKEKKPFSVTLLHFSVSAVGLFLTQGLMHLLGHGFSINLFTAFIALLLGIPGLIGMSLFLIIF